MTQTSPLGILKRIAYAAAVMFAATAGLRAQASTHPSTPVGFRNVTDEIGRMIRVPETIHRIVSLAPSLTETVYALGLQDRLVADTDYCDFPLDAQRKPKVGGAVNPSIETIASLHPDVVLVTRSLNRFETVEALANVGIPSYATDPQTVDSIIASTQRLGELLGDVESGKRLAHELEQRLAAVHDRIGSRPPQRVLFVVWTDPLISVGKGTFIADAIQHAGGASIVESSQNWPQVSLEEIVRLQPDFLVFARTHAQASAPSIDALAQLPGWRMLNAVKQRRAAVVSEGINWSSPRIVSAVEELARQLHPDAFGETVGAQLYPERRRESAATQRGCVPANALHSENPREAACAR